jgi:hypothetical protein
MYVDTNRELWNLWTKLNAASKECSDLLMQLKAGRPTLEKVELEELNPTCAGADQAISA